ncbi:odorant receptor 43a-like isoform X1 [Bradysia coprophila]|uniref:odorant receptor 43a-like isoform X1 n=1 Tax=Bradysia coprophila TaxID=38358 RepID=UPI00187DB07C|nr:odorant receptor 43a-like isoform X1 [Bradysia coprophila]
MFRMDIHPKIQRMVSQLCFFGFWHKGDVVTAGEKRMKLFYIIYFGLFPFILASGGVMTQNTSEKTFSIEVTIVTAVLELRLWYIISKKEQICELLNRISKFRLVDQETFTIIDKKRTVFMKFLSFFITTCSLASVYVALVAPFLGSEKKLFLIISIPSNWKYNELAYWMGFFCIAIQEFIAATVVLFGAIVWYLMANCAWQFEVLGDRISKMGEIRTNFDDRSITDTERDIVYSRDLIEMAALYIHVKLITKQLEAFLSKLFVVQIATGSVCICLSTYSIAFFEGDNFYGMFVYLTGMMYSIFDIFTITFLGNEIVLASNKLSYRLYESCWIGRGRSIRSNVLLFGTLLKKPHQMIILKMFPLTLDTFSKILNSAYSMFNILQRFK